MFLKKKLFTDDLKHSRHDSISAVHLSPSILTVIIFTASFWSWILLDYFYNKDLSFERPVVGYMKGPGRLSAAKLELKVEFRVSLVMIFH